MKIISVDKLTKERDLGNCPVCKSSRLVKSGHRYNKYSTIQKLKCNECGTRFAEGGHFGSKFPQEVKQLAVSLYEQGLSSRKVSTKIKEVLSLYVSYATILRWIRTAGVTIRKPAPKPKKDRLKKEIEIKTMVEFATLIQFNDSKEVIRMDYQCIIL